MRIKPLLVLLPAVLLLAGFDVIPPFKGNDIGGIIAWSPDAQRFRHEIAADHCAKYGKVHRIRSVHPWYGDYIGFECYWPRGTGPAEVILRRAY
jgi:hypothetical protein